jgi:hypothetical protein
VVSENLLIRLKPSTTGLSLALTNIVILFFHPFPANESSEKLTIGNLRLPCLPAGRNVAVSNHRRKRAHFGSREVHSQASKIELFGALTMVYRPLIRENFREKEGEKGKAEA